MWYSSFKPYLVAGLAIPTVATVYVLTGQFGMFPKIYVPIITACMGPILMICLYMYVNGKGWKYINGIDWSKYTEDERCAVTSRISLGLTVGSAVLTVGLSLIMINLAVSISLIVVSVVIYFVPMIGISRKAKYLKVPNIDSGKAAVLFAVAVLLFVPCVYLMTSGANGTNLNDVNVTLRTDSFSVEAPMVTYTLNYSDVTDLSYQTVFEKGTRVAGTSDGHLCTGLWNNNSLGDYTLASYRDVSPCIVFRSGGSWYAINQSSEQSTLALYNELSIRIA